MKRVLFADISRDIYFETDCDVLLQMHASNADSNFDDKGPIRVCSIVANFENGRLRRLGICV